ncbi:cation diffusion facilitator family transporter [uncultured Draconibacterium sp.]|uniref:cation diffusion facilitator family transporter n=1 Tax=uncultured Draconibacterium sp. TaxID=1573823 RepID=UPI0025F3CD4B|nr:cation diffusion facilitator family transporter [uncultured Draconibacterium sp.]
MEDSRKYTVRTGWFSIIGNILLSSLKYWAGVSTGSLALVADAWHSISDVVTSAIVLIGGKISRKPADDDHPFGHGRAEHIAAIIIGVVLAIVAFDFILNGIEKFGNREHTYYSTFAWIAIIISVIVNELMTQYSFWAGKKINSSMLIADGWHHRTDALSSVIVLIGIALGRSFWWTDAVLSIIVAILIGYASFEILSKEIKSLLGESPSDELLEKIHKTVSLNCTIRVNLHHIHLHNYGHHTEMSCHIKLPPEMTLYETHEICTKIEKAIKEEFGFFTTIHPEPLSDKLKSFERY